jgi:hypothetical protein
MARSTKLLNGPRYKDTFEFSVVLTRVFYGKITLISTILNSLHIQNYTIYINFNNFSCIFVQKIQNYLSV